MSDVYVIECRYPDGMLDFTAPQPESVFGKGVWEGIGADDMAQIIFRHNTTVELDGRFIEQWPTALDLRWSARLKTWR